jgi:hypothetical protein
VKRAISSLVLVGYGVAIVASLVPWALKELRR